MKKHLLLLIVGLFSILSVAHNPDVSTTMLVEKENNTWILQISASLTAFQQEIKTHFSEYKSPEEFQQMVLDHIKNNLEIKFNKNQDITLSKGIVRLGHETKVVFEVLGIPSDIKTVYVKNSAFKDINRNKSAFILLKKGFSKKNFELNNKNNHTLNLVTNQNSFVLEGKNEISIFSSKLLYVIGTFIVLGVFYLVKKRKNTN